MARSGGRALGSECLTRCTLPDIAHNPMWWCVAVLFSAHRKRARADRAMQIIIVPPKERDCFQRTLRRAQRAFLIGPLEDCDVAVLDLSNVRYLDAAAIGCFVALRRRMLARGRFGRAFSRSGSPTAFSTSSDRTANLPT